MEENIRLHTNIFILTPIIRDTNAGGIAKDGKIGLGISRNTQLPPAQNR